MVRAILDGSKTQTRRVVGGRLDCHDPRINAQNEVLPETRFCHIKPGDLLWVKETWGDGEENNTEPGIYYRATDPGWDEEDTGFRWKPSIFMPRWASRITLKVVSVRVERLQDISDEEALAEGVSFASGFYLGGLHPLKGTPKVFPSPVQAFESIWDSINAKKHPWASNPWVWVVEFEKVKP